MRKSALFALAVCTISTAGVGVAHAGEVTGSGKTLDVKSRSDCAYSGLEDYDGKQAPTPGVVQNWGFTKRDMGLSGGANSQTITIPGIGTVTIGCNAHLYPIK